MHIGKHIETRANELGIGSTALAKRLGISKQSVHNIYKRKSINTDLLMRISKALSYNFFKEYSQIAWEHDPNKSTVQEDIAELTKLIKEVSSDVRKMRSKLCERKQSEL